MKTICTKVGDVSIHLFEDFFNLEIKDSKIFVFDQDQKLIMCLANSNLYLIYENIPAPDNWCPKKYRFSNKFGWKPSSDWKFPYEDVFEVLYQKHLQLVQCLHENSILDDDNFRLLTETKSLENIIKEYKSKYENTLQ